MILEFQLSIQLERISKYENIWMKLISSQETRELGIVKTVGSLQDGILTQAKMWVTKIKTCLLDWRISKVDGYIQPLNVE